MNQKTNRTIKLPPRPREPDPSECCGRGCDPCVYTYYERALERWHEKIAKLKQHNTGD
jgi:hypothetical protein